MKYQTTQNSYGTIKRKNGRKNSGPADVVSALGTVIFFPLALIYLEIVFHLYMGMEMKYLPIYLLFSIPIGCVCALLTINFNEKINFILTCILTGLFSLIFCIEIVCKAVLQQYYQLLSTADTAANNSLLDYFDAIVTGITDNIFGLLLMFVPLLFIATIGRMVFNFKRKNVRVSILAVSMGIVAHLLGLLTLILPWQGDFVPKALYQSDTDIEDQVEQLGILTMLRLDVKHTLLGGASRNHSTDDLSDLNEVLSQQNSANSSENNTPAEENTDDATNEETQPQETQPTVDTSPNVMNIDFDALTASSANENVSWLNEYFKNVTPTNKNEYTGMFKDYNVIFITAEGFSGYMIDEKLTPTLYKLSHEGFVFNNYYTPLHFTSTSGGEFQNLTGLYPKNGNPISMKEVGINQENMYFSLASQLNRLGYLSQGYHANKDMYGRLASHTALGYNWIQQDSGFTMETSESGKEIWPQSDLYLMEHSIDDFINSEKPFNIYYLTISGHMPYNFSGDMMAVRNQDVVANLPYSEETKAYLAANYELEKAMTYLVNRLEDAGIADKTVIVFTADHVPYFNANVIEELAGRSFGSSDLSKLQESDLDFDIYRNSLIIWSGSIKEPIQVDKICGQVDILPTISNLLGLEYDSRLLSGSDILSDSTPLVVFSSQCWKTDKGLYNRYTGEFTPAEGVTMTQEEIDTYVAAMKKIVRYKLDAATTIVETDYYNTIFPK